MMVSMRRLLIAVMLIACLFASAPQASAATCINVLGIEVPCPTITVQGPVVTLPPLPRVTVTVPGPVRTVTVPGPVQTVQGPIRTVTVTQTPQASPAPNSTTVTLPSGQTTTKGDTIVKPGKPVIKTKTVRITVPQAVGFSLALIVIGALLGLLALYIVYLSGYSRGQDKGIGFLKELRAIVRK